MDLRVMQKHKIHLDYIAKGLAIELYPVIADTLFQTFDAAENNEAEHQIVEGCFYQYKLSENYCLQGSAVIQVSNFNPSEGRISPNTYVGTLDIPILKDEKKCGVLKLEVRSIKTSYRKDYRFMLESITKHATDLILQTNSPVNQTLETDFEKGSKTLYQQFCFVKSIIDTEDFEIAIHQIIKSPVTAWSTQNEDKDVRSLKRLNGKEIKSLIHSQNRARLPSDHNLRDNGIQSIALKVATSIKEETTDTPENRFINYVLESFLYFCEEIQLKTKEGSRLHQEAEIIAHKLESYLQHNLFKEVSKLTIIKLNSPVLQKKAGYREVLKTWLMFDLAAKLVWEGGEDVYAGGSKNIATLYEYWLFFKLLDVIKEIFHIKSDEYRKLIDKTDDTLGLILKQGKQIALMGTYISKQRQLSIQFSYNKTFSHNSDLTKEGSWTLQMDPDYTLSIWPKELDIATAEKSEQIVHIHFDAKYKVKNKKDNSEFKSEDVIKMHAYKDAIRRTGGAYIIYPGVDKVPTQFEGFHEIFPGLGAFAIRPSETDSGIHHLKDFVNKVKNHFLNRATQRENIATKTYEITKDGKSKSLNEHIPEYLDGSKLIPNETSVLVGYLKNGKHAKWCLESLRYNIRYGTKYSLGPNEIGAKYVLLYSNDEGPDPMLFRLSTEGPKFYSDNELLNELYYPTKPSVSSYLVYKLMLPLEEKFNERFWRVPVSPHTDERPFTISLTELLNLT